MLLKIYGILMPEALNWNSGVVKGIISFYPKLFIIKFKAKMYFEIFIYFLDEALKLSVFKVVSRLTSQNLLSESKD